MLKPAILSYWLRLIYIKKINKRCERWVGFAECHLGIHYSQKSKHDLTAKVTLTTVVY